MNDETTATNTDEVDDTEGNCFKYRDDGPAGPPDDTDGHTANAHRVPRGDDSNGRGKKAPG